MTSWLVTTADSPAVSACSLVGSGASTMSSTVGTAGLIASEAAIIDGSDEWWADTVWNCRGRCRLGRSQTRAAALWWGSRRAAPTGPG